MTPSKIFDILIIGSGPAGLSAALAASRQFRTTLVLSSPAHPYRNSAAHHMHNVLGFDHVPPALFRGHAVMQLKDRYSPFIDFVEDANISSVKKAEVDNKGGMDLFVAADAQGRSWKGRKVILATGSRDIFPDIQGYAGVWGNGMQVDTESLLVLPWSISLTVALIVTVSTARSVTVTSRGAEPARDSST